MLMFLKSVSEALVAKGLGALKGFVPFGNVIYDVGADAVDRYRKVRKEAQLKADAEALLKAEMKEVRAEAERIVREVAKGESEEIIDLAVAYLTQMPGTIRQSLKRADDPSGTTIPATLNLSDPVQLSSVLPRRLPTFRAGDAVPHAPQWKFVELLGAGGFGEVWLARHAYLDDLRAFKFCLDPAARNRLLTHEKDVVRRVMKASTAVSDADHGIVRLLDCYLEPDGPWLAYEYVDGGDLTAWSRANALLAPPERAVNAMNMVRDLAAVVGRFHALPQPVIHRDLKPANVLLKKANGRWLLRVTDFGIGHVAASAGLARATVSTPSMSLGDTFRGAHTPTYASPQQKRGEPADPRDDVHALGVIALQLLLGDLTAERPSGNSWRKKLKDCELPGEVLKLLARCWEDDPEERPSNAGEVFVGLASPSPGERGVRREGESSQASGGYKPPVAPTPLQPEGLPPPAQASGVGIETEAEASAPIPVVPLIPADPPVSSLLEALDVTNSISRRLDRIPTAKERAAFDEIGLPPGCWAALYAAPLARIASKVMLQHRSMHYTTRETMWPWVYARESFVRKLAEASLQSIADTPQGASAIEICVEWLRGVLPPLGNIVNGLALEKAYVTHRPRLLAAIELLATHLAKDIPPTDRQKWLLGCAWSGILAEDSFPIWPRTVSKSARTTEDQIETKLAQEIAEDLGKRVEFWVPERQYAISPKEVEQFDLMALIECVVLLGVARKLNLQIQPGSRFVKLAANLGHQAPAFARWLKTAEVSRVGVVVPTDVFEEAKGILVTELARFPAAGREAFIADFHKRVLNCSQKVKKDNLARCAHELTAELRLAIQNRK